jgi:outer membrane protein OmpA-like peptidoglycan-associated protein
MKSLPHAQLPKENTMLSSHVIDRLPSARGFRRGLFHLSLAALLSSALFVKEASGQETGSAAPAPEILREQPVWWFGAAAAGNLNFYWGTTQQLNDEFSTPAAFHKGIGAGLYLAPLIEYRPGPMWGGILQIGYDDRRAAFYDVTCPCGENSTLKAKPSYVSIEPSLRLAPFSGDFYLFAGPRVAFAWSAFGEDKQFAYTQEGAGSTQGDFDNWRAVVFSGQVGLGYDVRLTPENARTQMRLAPFASYQPHFGQDPRSSENWAVSTLRVGATLKFGRGKAVSSDPGVRFSVIVPKPGSSKRRVRESFPLRNYLYFEDSSSRIPARYALLNKREASDFREENLQENPPKSLKGRSARQLAVYSNLLNVVGDRMKRNPDSRILLSGSSVKGPAHGKVRAEEAKRYLVETFGIDGKRIATEGRENARAQDQSQGTRDMQLLQAGNQRVEVTSASPELLLQVGSPQEDLKPVSIEGPVEEVPDSVVFNASGATDSFNSWMLEVTDDQGKMRRFGPYTENRAALPAGKILGNRDLGDYKVVLVGQAKDGSVVRKQTSIRLVRPREGIQEVTRFTILFDFGQTKTVAAYETFLTEVVAPRVSDSSVVIIRGQTDNVGEPDFNDNLSRERAQGTQAILEKAITANGRRGVTYETTWYGESSEQAPFENGLPEERAYNRTVIVDIVPR